MTVRHVLRSLVICLGIAGCAGTYNPRIVDLPEGLEVRIRYPDRSEFDGHLKFSRILPFYLAVINRSNQTLELNLDGITLDMGLARPLKAVRWPDVYKQMERTGGELLDKLTLIPRSQSSAFHPPGQRLAKSFKDLYAKVNRDIERDLVGRAYAEGRIVSGGSRKGFVFFRLPEDLPETRRAVFRFTFRNPATGAVFHDFQQDRTEIDSAWGSRPVKTVIKEEIEAGQKFALVIGVEQYRGEGIRELRYARDDAKAVYDHLVQKAGYERDNVRLLLDTQATRQAIEDSVAWLWSKAKGDRNSVLFYFAGHGSDEVNPETGQHGYLLAIDVADNRSESITARGYAMDRLRNIIVQFLPADRIAIVLDACFSGGGRSIGAAGALANPALKGHLAKFVEGKGRILLTACQWNESSKKHDQLQHGVFTYYLLEALEKGYQKTQEIYTYLLDRVKDFTDQTQKPELMYGTIFGNPALF